MPQSFLMAMSQRVMSMGMNLLRSNPMQRLGRLLRSPLPVRRCGLISLFFGCGERVLNLLAAIEGRDEDKQGASCHDQAQCAFRFVTLVICVPLARDSLYRRYNRPRMSSCTSSSTKFMS